MGAVDLVVQVESPHSVASGLQRIGRAGHGVGEVSAAGSSCSAAILEAAVVVRGMRRGEVESTRVPRNPLDVLAQQLVAVCLDRDWSLAELEALVQRAYPYRTLSREVLVAVLDMLTGRMPLGRAVHPDQLDAIADERGFDEVRPLLNWDRATDQISARRAARLTVVANPGTIADRGTYGVFIAPEGPRVGQLDEEMVHEARAGEVFLLGASSWRIVEIKRDRVLVAPAPGQPGKMPFWRGQGPGRPVDLGREMGALVAEVGARLQADPAGGEACAWLAEHALLDPLAAKNLVAYIQEQLDAAGVLPTDRAITVERFQDELGDWRVCLLSPFGARVNAPWALAIQARLEQRSAGEVQALWTDDGIILRVPDASLLPDLDDLVPSPDEIEDLVTEQVGRSAIFASSFREAAGRSLLLPRRRPGARVPLWLQRMKAQNLMASAMAHPSYPVVLEAYRECLQDIFDLPGLQEILGEVHAQRLRLDRVDTPTPSPFARSLVFAFVATWLYEGDAPLAERRVHALSIDRALLRDLLGSDDLRDLLDAEVIAAVEDDCAGAPPPRGLCGRAARPAPAAGRPGQQEIRAVGRGSDALAPPCCMGAARSRCGGGVKRWIAIEDAGRYRDGLGVAPPGGIPSDFLEERPHAFESLLLRFARVRGPFTAQDVAERWGIAVGPVVASLDALSAQGRLLAGCFSPGEEARTEWCDPKVMRRIKRRTLAKLRGEVEPVEAHAVGRFLPAWHGLADASAARASAFSKTHALLLEALGDWRAARSPSASSDADPARAGAAMRRTSSMRWGRAGSWSGQAGDPWDRRMAGWSWSVARRRRCCWMRPPRKPGRPSRRPSWRSWGVGAPASSSSCGRRWTPRWAPRERPTSARCTRASTSPSRRCAIAAPNSSSASSA